MIEPNATATLALDRLPSARIFDHDGHLHVEQVHITKAGVSPYLGREIIGWEELGLDPDQVYRLLRDPVSLEKGAPTLNNKPLLFGHNPIHASKHDHDRTVGTVSKPTWNPPYLDADMACWSNKTAAIDCIKDDTAKELSSAYHYTPVMEPGNYEGEPFDGRMTKIAFNHVALVPKGRVGADCFVTDSAEHVLAHLSAATAAVTEFVAAQSGADAQNGPAGSHATDGTKQGTIHMAKGTDVLSRAAVRTQDVLFGHYRSKIAQDKALDLAPLLKGLTAKNFAARKPALVLGLQSGLRGKVAQDEDVEIADVPALVEAIEAAVVEEVADQSGMTAEQVAGAAAGDPTAEDDADMTAFKAMLKEKGVADDVADEICAAVSKMMPANAVAPATIVGDAKVGAPPEKKPPAMDAANFITRREAEVATRKAVEDARKGMLDKPAMDAAMEAATTAERKRQSDLRDAEKFVRPWVGDLAIACDSAEAVHRAALTALGVEHKGVHPDALLPILKAQPKPGESPRASAAFIAQDAALAEDYAKRFPNADRLKH